MDEQVTFRTIAYRFLREKSRTLAATSYEIYEGLFERYIFPAIGDEPPGKFSRLTKKELDQIVQEISDRYVKEVQLKSRSLQMIRRLIKSVVLFWEEEDEAGGIDEADGTAVPLTGDELRQVLLCARNHRTPEMLAVLLILYCGIRRGEVCALGCEDIDVKKREIYIHRAVHRIKRKDPDAVGEKEEDNIDYNAAEQRKENEKAESETLKTVIEITELYRKNQIRTVEIPEELMGYVREFYREGVCLLTGEREKPMDPRTIKNRVDRIFETAKMERISFRQLHKTYTCGKSDKKLLREIFPAKDGILARQAIDQEDLTGRMAQNLSRIRKATGFSLEDMSEVLDISISSYENIEMGKEELTWVQYLALLWVFQNNTEGRKLIENEGVLPEGLLHFS